MSTFRGESTFAVVGARGFIGRTVASEIERRGMSLVRLRHDDPVPRNPRIVIYCTGIRSGSRPESRFAQHVHVDVPRALLAQSACERFVYLSSTRVYDSMPSTCEDEDVVGRHHDDVFVRTKRSGEATVLSDPRGVVIRLANVFGCNFGSQVFLSDILRQAARANHIDIRSSLASEKDYVSVGDVAALIPQIAREGNRQIYNIATGKNTTHASIIAAFEERGVTVSVPADAPDQKFAPIQIERLRSEFTVPVQSVIDELPWLMNEFRKAFVPAQ